MHLIDRSIHDRTSLIATSTHDRRHDDPQHVDAAYGRAVKNFNKHLSKSPDKLTFEHVREYQLNLVSRGLGPQAVNQTMCALRFFYKTTLGIKEQPITFPWRAGPTHCRRFYRGMSPSVIRDSCNKF